jgi:hypothetical protein
MANDALKQLIKQIIQEELLDELSATGAASGGEGPPQTPYAYSRKKLNASNEADEGETPRMKEIAKHSMPDRDSNVVDKHNPSKVNEARARYYNFREANEYKKNGSKISFAIQEIKKMLKEVDYLAKISNRLKAESDVGNGAYWGKTSKDLEEIVNYTKRISGKMRGLR